MGGMRKDEREGKWVGIMGELPILLLRSFLKKVSNKMK